MSEAEDSGPVENLTQSLTDTIEELEETQDELEDLVTWTTEAQDEWDQMSQENKAAFIRRASEFQTQLRNASTSQDLVEQGREIQDAFSEPIQQTAVAGFYQLIELLDLEITDEHITELEETIIQRPSSDLQADAEGYEAVQTTLNGELPVVRGEVARKIESDPARYLVGPSHQLIPLVGHIEERRITLSSVEEQFQEADEWVPDSLATLSSDERFYANPADTVDTEEVREEIRDIDSQVDTIRYDIAEIVQNEVRRQLNDCSPGQLQSGLNNIATKLIRFETQYQDAIEAAESVVTNEEVPESLTPAVEELHEELNGFSVSSFSNFDELNSAAESVNEQFERFVEETSDELQTLDSMCTEIRLSFDVEAVRETPTPDGLSSFLPSAIRDDLPVVFQSIAAHRTWIDDAFDTIATQFESENVRNLFERLYTEESVPMSEVNIEALRDLQDELQLIISLRQ